jgi:hypothetical protein
MDAVLRTASGFGRWPASAPTTTNRDPRAREEQANLVGPSTCRGLVTSMLSMFMLAEPPWLHATLALPVRQSYIQCPFPVTPRTSHDV